MIAVQSETFPIFVGFIAQKFDWILSTSIFFEYLEKTQELSTPEAPLRLRQMLLSMPNSIAIEPKYNWRLITADRDDDKFVDCAIAGNADYLVTDDKHYRRLKDIEFPKLKVVTGKMFLEILQGT